MMQKQLPSFSELLEWMEAGTDEEQFPLNSFCDERVLSARSVAACPRPSPLHPQAYGTKALQQPLSADLTGVGRPLLNSRIRPTHAAHPPHPASFSVLRTGETLQYARTFGARFTNGEAFAGTRNGGFLHSEQPFVMQQSTTPRPASPNDDDGDENEDEECKPGTSPESNPGGSRPSRLTSIQYVRQRVYWKADEDERLHAAVLQFRPNQWSRVADSVKTRSRKQCRARWVNYHQANRLNREWTADEDRELLRQLSIHGKRWSRIASSIPGRTENDCKNRYHSIFLLHEREPDTGYTAHNSC
ncbi:Transcription factor MYB52 [Porphyridium purpureum]|uniref:Transcription factor MYB52 n=1 Tax=Porphyridium purpureum TaxID=35688 RepID=A0A5J4Z8R2_PORPP|nr:Transcription factor MYB52 [Porphyridium purpureum]|eukprot:POR6258..scf295_1